MSDHKELLKSMLQDFIKNNQEQSAVTLHNYVVAKTQQVTNLVTPNAIDDSNDVNNTDVSDE